MSEANGYATPELLFGGPLRREFKDVEVDEFKFRIRTWTSLESSKWRLKNMEDPETTNERAIILSCVTADGEPQFSEQHIKQLQDMGAGFVGRLADLCVTHAAGKVDTKKN